MVLTPTKLGMSKEVLVVVVVLGGNELILSRSGSRSTRQ